MSDQNDDQQTDFNEKFDEKKSEKIDEKFDEKKSEKIDEKFNEKKSEKFNEKKSEKLNEKIDDKIDEIIDKKIEEKIEEKKPEIIDEIILEIDPSKLTPHPQNAVIYGKLTEKLLMDLIIGISILGQLVPITVDQYFRIISGHRRVAAIIYLNKQELLKKKADPSYIPQLRKVRYIMKIYKTEDEIKEVIVEFNKNRIKKPFQIYNELTILKPIIAARADARKKSKLKQFSVGPDLGQRDNDKTINTDDELGLAVGLSGSQVHNLMYVYDRGEKKIANALDVIKKIEDEDLSTDAGYKLLKLMDARDNPTAKIKKAPKKVKDIAAKARDLTKKIELGSITPNKADENFKKYVKEYDNTSLKQATKEHTQEKTENETAENETAENETAENETAENETAENETTENETAENETTEKTEETDPKIRPAEIYDVVVADPKNTEQENDFQHQPFMKNSALFLWANIQNIFSRLMDLNILGYKLVSIAVLSSDEISYAYFDDTIDFVLLGLRGHIEPNAEYEPEVFLYCEDTKNKYEVIYTIAEKMFPGRQYLDPFNDTGRDGWGKLVIEVENEEEKEEKKEEEEGEKEEKEE